MDESKSIVKSDLPAAQQAKKLDIIRPKDGMATFYANHLQLGQTNFDARIVFGEITDVDDTRIEVTQRVQVTMAWLEVKALAVILTNAVSRFEELNGPFKEEFAPLEKSKLPDFPRTAEPKK